MSRPWLHLFPKYRWPLNTFSPCLFWHLVLFLNYPTTSQLLASFQGTGCLSESTTSLTVCPRPSSLEGSSASPVPRVRTSLTVLLAPLLTPASLCFSRRLVHTSALGPSAAFPSVHPARSPTVDHSRQCCSVAITCKRLRFKCLHSSYCYLTTVCLSRTDVLWRHTDPNRAHGSSASVFSWNIATGTRLSVSENWPKVLATPICAPYHMRPGHLKKVRATLKTDWNKEKTKRTFKSILTLVLLILECKQNLHVHTTSVMRTRSQHPQDIWRRCVKQEWEN